MADTLADCRRLLPSLFASALQRLEQRASAGDAGVRSRLDAIGAQPVESLLQLQGEGGGELHLRAGRDGLRVVESAVPAGFGYALGLPTAAARDALALIEDARAAEIEAAGRGLAALASATARELFGATPFELALTIAHVPELGTLRLLLGLGRAALPARPEFELLVDYDDLEDAYEQGTAPHQLFLAGKMRIEGDVAKAMVLGMVLAQLE